jgi:hypothetical protein
MKIAFGLPWLMRKPLFQGGFLFVTDADFWTCWRTKLQRFQQSGCGGTKLLPEFTLKIGLFSLRKRRNFQIDP